MRCWELLAAAILLGAAAPALANEAAATSSEAAPQASEPAKPDDEVVVEGEKQGDEAYQAESVGDPTKPGLEDDMVICKDYKKTGSRLGRRKICKTAREWQFEKEQTKRGVDEMRDKTSRSGAPG
jgi:hypothetical protein